MDKGAPNGNFAGPTGSVLGLDVQRSSRGNGVLACVGLDRFLRLYDLVTRVAIGKVYCKTKMTSVLVIEGLLESSGPTSPPGKRKKLSEAHQHVADEDDSDSVWALLPELSNVNLPAVKRRRVRA